MFGAHGFKINPLLAQDYVGADFRALFYYPEKAGSSKDGAGIMSGSVFGHVAVDEAQRIHLVLEHNIAGFSAGPYRDTYALFQFHNRDERPHWFESLLVGRFRTPFGIVTDEHRTYTRIQTQTEWFSFDTGAMLSGQPSEDLHYDLALVNGDRHSGANLNNGNAERFGATLNLRYMLGPIMLGTSLSHYDRRPSKESRQALSLYAVASLARWTDDNLPLSIKVETVRARNWNDHLGQGFAADQSYVSSIRTAESSTWLAWLEYAFTSKFILLYKYDFLRPDRDYPADIYDRHGLGIRWYIGPNTVIQARTELARATHPTEAARHSEAAQNASFGFLQVTF